MCMFWCYVVVSAVLVMSGQGTRGGTGGDGRDSERIVQTEKKGRRGGGDSKRRTCNITVSPNAMIRHKQYTRESGGLVELASLTWPTMNMQAGKVWGIKRKNNLSNEFIMPYCLASS